jgi:hypothetical protein
MSTSKPTTTTRFYPDQSARLMLVGIFQVLLGSLSGLMALLMAATPLLLSLAPQPQGPAMNAQGVIQAMVFYLLIAVVFIWLGIGLVRARRWAWTLTVVLSWMWLVIGLVSFVAFVFLIGPMVWETMARDGKVPREMIMGILMVMGLFVACVYILLPGLFLVVCHRESVRATCQKRDPKIRWTDRCPMPVLALSIMLALSLVSLSSLVSYGCVMPIFGVYFSGAAGAVVIALLAIVLIYLAWGTYRLQMAAWWGTVVLWIVGILNSAVTFSRGGLMELYEKMGLPAEQLELIRKSGLVESLAQWGPLASLVGGSAVVACLLYVRRYFVQASSSEGPVDSVSALSPAGDGSQLA